MALSERSTATRSARHEHYLMAYKVKSLTCRARDPARPCETAPTGDADSFCASSRLRKSTHARQRDIGIGLVTLSLCSCSNTPIFIVDSAYRQGWCCASWRKKIRDKCTPKWSRFEAMWIHGAISIIRSLPFDFLIGSLHFSYLSQEKFRGKAIICSWHLYNTIHHGFQSSWSRLRHYSRKIALPRIKPGSNP